MDKSYTIKMTSAELLIMTQSIEKIQILGKDSIIVGSLLKKLYTQVEKVQAASNLDK